MSREILITRPTEDADRDARALSDLGYRTRISSLLSIEKITDTPTIPDQYDIVIFTSANAVRFLENISLNTPIYTVGNNTSQAAQKAGYTNIININGTAETLAKKIIDALPKDKIILFPHGQHTAYPLEEILTKNGYRVESQTLYKTKKVQSLTPKTIEKIKKNSISAITLYSQRSAENLVNLLKQHALTNYLKQTKLLCISPSVLKYVHLKMPEDVWQSAYSATHPNRDGMFKLIKEQINKNE